MTVKRRAIAAGAAVLAMALLAACGGNKATTTTNSNTGAGFNAAVGKVVNPSTKKGGTLQMWSSQDADSWDPAIGYYAFVWDLNQLYTRTLVTYPAQPGTAGLKLAPDLASAMPDITDGGKTYTFHLRSGIKFDDGTAITSKDIKYGIERIFAQDVLPGGPIYLMGQLDEGQNYPGPYKDKDPAGLKSIETPDDSTIIFHLKAPYADFPYLLAMPGAGPVPQARDTGAKYALKPASSGPYMFQSYEPGKSTVWVRNPNWDPSTDPIRKALPDKINLTITSNADDLDSRLIAGTADIDVGQTGVQSAAQIKVLQNPSLKANTDAPPNGFIRYAAFATTVAPFDNIDCRKAVMYAADHTALQTARGGPIGGGPIAPNMLPPNILGSDTKYDPYNIVQGKPQLDKAKEELQKCGKPNGFSTTIAVRNNKDKEIKSAEALQQSLAAVGIKANIYQYDGKLLSTVIGAPDNVKKNGYGIMIAGWGADWPSGTGYLQPLIDQTFILKNGNYNLPEIKDPQIQSLFQQTALETDPTKAAALYNQMNHIVMEGAYYLPFTYDAALNYRNPRLTNVFVNQAWGMIDFQALGVSDGK
ncbi:ABC transporter substrate-binding protein [Rugosimonospora africana]|uniref:Peptide ABC transporter substrate-binding protein n=1 Tax=Rugosimonospora africana TaxID=556532 RepID=A0A8J3VTI9_9ACTN|nr:ABC transporter substrate-binding protein [Rugosimonospora africana]GIH18235.1 peptide ABC transporter substrate-binding protein [Rugosimonospora africana]